MNVCCVLCVCVCVCVCVRAHECVLCLCMRVCVCVQYVCVFAVLHIPMNVIRTFMLVYGKLVCVSQ